MLTCHRQVATHAYFDSCFLQILALSSIAAIALVDALPRLPRATPESVGMSGERLQAATTLLRQFVADRKIIGAVAAVARRGKVVYLEPVGLQDLESKAPMTEASLFRVYSMTKAVTAVGVMMLVEEGKLRLSDPASKFLPEFKNVKVQNGDTGDDAAAGARRHHPGSPAAHLGLEPSDIGPVSPTPGALAQHRPAAIRDQHHQRAAARGSRPAVPLQRGHHGARPGDRSRVAPGLRRLRHSSGS